MAHNLPSYDLTPESRVPNPFMKDWHNTTDHEFDLQLDLLFSEDSVPKDSQYGHRHDHNFDWSMPTSGGVSDMEDHANALATATEAQMSQVAATENHQAPLHGATAHLLDHAVNDFDNPEYHIQNAHPIDHGSLAHADSSSFAEPKQEAAASIVKTSHNLTMPAPTPAEYQITNGPPDMQRVATAPPFQSSHTWSNNHSHGLPPSNGTYSQIGGVHQGLQNNSRNPSSIANVLYGQMRAAQITDPDPTFHQRQQRRSNTQPNSWHPMSVNNVWDQNVAGYAPTQSGNGISYQSYHPAGKRNVGFNSPGSFTNGKQFNISDSNAYHHLLNSNSLQGNLNNHRLVDSHNLHHQNNETSFPMMNGNNPYFHPTRSHEYMNVPDSKILTSQPQFGSNLLGSNKRSSDPRPRSTSEQRTQYLDMDEEDDDPELPEIDLEYDSIEAARTAERPKVRTHSHKDETIPRTDEEKQVMVKGLMQKMLGTAQAQDNPGMINQWMKLRQDRSRVEQACWRVLDMCLRIHVDGVPLVPNKASCQRYTKMKARWYAICHGLRTQKTMCKHLLGADFSAQLVNDPETATTRVTNNRKVNAGKKTFLDKGKRVAAQNGQGNNARRPTSISPEDDSNFGELGDEDAEGEPDDGYQYFPENAGHAYQATPQLGSTPHQAPGPARAYKHEREDDDSDYAAGRGKKPKPKTSGSRRTPSNGNIRKRRQPRGSRSQYQAVNDGGRHIMIDVGQLRNEEIIRAHGSPQMQARFDAIHYPNGRPTDANGCHRISRAAAPTTFRGVSNSDEVVNEESGSQYEGTEDEHHQHAGSPQS